MATFKSDFLRIMDERGFIHQISDPESLDTELAKGPMTAYVGYDCTAASLHVGNLLSIMMLHWFQQTGNRPIALMGGGTTRVGDPSGRDETRRILSADDIAANKREIGKNFAAFLEFGDGSSDAVMVDNADWLLGLAYIDFLRDVGRHFSVNQMIQRDSVRLRLEREHHLSFLEFNYMVLQAYDYLELNRRYGCRLQMGGSDQWGNIVSGVDLGRRIDNVELFALTTPLLTTSSGAKMGKTASGAVWLSPDLLSPYEYWQFWRNTEDADVVRFLKVFTTLPLDEIDRLGKLDGSEINEAKKILANEATALLHGRAAAENAAETSRQTFEEGGLGEDLPTIEMERRAFDEGLGILSAFVSAGLAQSNSEARRHIKGKAARVNDDIITDERLVLKSDAINEDGLVKLSIGRKKHVLLKPL